MKKMTLAQKKRRLKAIKADLAKHAKKPKSIGTLPNLRVPVGRFSTMPELLTLASMVSAEAREADSLPGEWVKLPPMTWPETLPVKVPLYQRTGTDHFVSFAQAGFIGWASHVGYALFHSVLAGRMGKKAMQSAWSETLVRLGYTEDA